MSVSLNLQQIGLYLKRLLDIPFSFFEKKYFITKVSRITEKTILFRSCYVLLLLHKFKLFSNYSTISLFNQKYFHVSLCKNNSFHLQTRRALFSSFEHVHSSFGKMMVKKLHVETYLEKHHPSRKEFIICKSKNSLVKNLQFNWDRIVRTCNLKCIF